jgi:hypothetical protein
MKKYKEKLGITFGTMIIALSLSLALANTVKAMTITTSDHTYKSYSLNIQSGEEELINASDIIKYLNSHEEGYTNTIEENAWFYRTGNQNGIQPAITTTALTDGAGLSVYEIADSNYFVKSIRIKGTAVGCSRISGLFEWRDVLTGTPNTIHKYPFACSIYVHIPVSGIKVISNNVDDNTSGISYYTYVGNKDKFDINILPFNSSYLTWDKVSNNAIQNINTSTSDSKVVSLSDIGNYTWSNSKFSINGVKEGTATVKVSSQYDSSAVRNINVNVLTKPSYSVSDTELTLAKNTTVSDRIYSTVSNLGNMNKCDIKWTSSNSDIVEVENATTSKPTLITKAAGKVTLKCQFTDLVAKNNKSVNATTLSVTVNVKDDKEISNKIVTSNNTYIEDGDTITSKNEGDVIFIRVEEFGEEAGYKCQTSDTEVCKVSKSSRSGYSFQIEKKGVGTAIITITTNSGKTISFNYEASSGKSLVEDPYVKKIIDNNIKSKKILKPKFKSVKIKKNTLYVKIKKSAAKYNAKGFQVKIKRNGKTIINRKWYKKKLKLTNIKKHSKYVIYLRTFNGKKKSKWIKITRKSK